MTTLFFHGIFYFRLCLWLTAAAGFFSWKRARSSTAAAFEGPAGLLNILEVLLASAPKEQFNCFQKIQNDSIRACLRLPSYIRTSLLHEYASIAPVKERLCVTATKLLGKMRKHNEHINQLVADHDPVNSTRHFSPLDVLNSS